MPNKKSVRTKFTTKKRHKPGAPTYSKTSSQASTSESDSASDAGPNSSVYFSDGERSEADSDVVDGSLSLETDHGKNNDGASDSTILSTCSPNTTSTPTVQDHCYTFKVPILKPPRAVTPSMEQCLSPQDSPTTETPADGHVPEQGPGERTTEIIPEVEVAGSKLDCLSNVDLLTAAKDKIQLFLPQRMHAILHLDAVHVVLVSPHNNLSIQRTMVFSRDGSIQLFVHRKELSVERFLCKDFSPVFLERESINEFVDVAVSTVNRIREMEICIGYDNLKFKNAWSSCSLGKEEDNTYDETRYTETFRSTTCAMLIPHRRWRCTECAALYGTLKRRSEFLAVQEPHPCTNNNIMSDTQKLKKMEELHRKLENEKRKNAHLRERMRKLIEKEGVPVDEGTARDLTNLLRDADLTEAQSIFLQEQVKASQKKKMCGMRWHPTMIRLALSIHLVSPAALELLRQTGMIHLPSSRTLFDYSHVKPVNDGVDTVVLESIAKKLKDLPQKKKYHVLMADEMHISQNLVFEKSTGKMIGYTKLDELDQEIDSMNQYLDNPEKEREEKQAKKF